MTANCSKFSGSVVLLLLPIMAGCRTETGLPAGTLVPAPPIIAKDDPIKSYAQYHAEVVRASESLPSSIGKETGTRRCIACIGELAKLPSASSYAYAVALISALRQSGIDPQIQLPASTSKVNSISYAELARVAAITRAMFRDRSEDGTQ